MTIILMLTTCWQPEQVWDGRFGLFAADVGSLAVAPQSSDNQEDDDDEDGEEDDNEDDDAEDAEDDDEDGEDEEDVHLLPLLNHLPEHLLLLQQVSLQLQ